MMQPFVFSCWLFLWHDVWLLQFHPKTRKSSDDLVPGTMGSEGNFSPGNHSLCIQIHKVAKYHWYFHFKVTVLSI